MSPKIMLIAVFLVFTTNIVLADAYLICDWSKVTKNDHVEFLHMHSKKQKKGISYFSRADLLIFPNQDKVKLKFKTKCGFMEQLCDIASAKNYHYFGGIYTLNRENLVLTSRLVVGGELPKETQCQSVTKETWMSRQKPTIQENNQI
jgi:hypothetical protein